MNEIPTRLRRIVYICRAIYAHKWAYIVITVVIFVITTILLALVYPSQIPYTGLDLGHVGTFLYWFILIVWSVVLACVVLFIIIPLLKRKTRVLGTHIHILLNEPFIEQTNSISKDTPNIQEVTKPDREVDIMEDKSLRTTYNDFKSSAQSGALSVDDIVHGLSRSKQETVSGGASVLASSTVSDVRDTSESLSGILSTSSMIRSKNTKDEASVKDVDSIPDNDFKSSAQSGALSVDDIVHGLSRSKQETVSGGASVLASSTVSDVRDTSESLSGILSTSSMIRSKNTKDEASVKVPSIPLKSVEEEQVIQTNGTDINNMVSVRGFLATLLEGDRTAVFYALRQITRGGGDATRFLTDATCMLDDAFRARIDGTDCDADIVRLVAKYQTPVLEEIVSALATAIDSSYSSGVTGAKLALAHALSRIGA